MVRLHSPTSRSQADPPPRWSLAHSCALRAHVPFSNLAASLASSASYAYGDSTGYLMPSPPPATPSPTRRCPRASGQQAPRQRHHRCPSNSSRGNASGRPAHRWGHSRASAMRGQPPLSSGVSSRSRRHRSWGTLVAQRAGATLVAMPGVAVVGADAEGFCCIDRSGRNSRFHPSAQSAPSTPPTVPSKCRG